MEGGQCLVKMCSLIRNTFMINYVKQNKVMALTLLIFSFINHTQSIKKKNTKRSKVMIIRKKLQ